MKDEIKETLKILNEDFGVQVFTAPGQFRGAIADVPIKKHSKKIRHLLKLAINDVRAYSRLEAGLVGSNKKNSFPIEVLIKEMSNDYEIKEEAARIVIEAIAQMLGYVIVPKQEAEKEIKQEQKKPRPSIRREPIKEVTSPPPLPKKVSLVGKAMAFGRLKWRILKVNEDGTALIISENILKKMAFHNRKANVAWDQSDLRRYLNINFYNMFTKEEQKRILTTRNKNPVNANSGIMGGDDTLDKVFLFTIDEVNALFKNDKDRIALYGGTPGQWWLRSPGARGDFAALVLEDGSISVFGDTSLSSHSVSKGIDYLAYRVSGVRPSMLITL